MDKIGSAELPRWIRAIPWDDVRADVAPEIFRPRARRQCAAGPVSRGLQRGVPRSLRHQGCMWLEEGDESRSCGRPATWTIGYPFGQARLYCEAHGWQIFCVVQHRRGTSCRPER